MTRRALSPVIGPVLLLVVTLPVAGAASASLLNMASLEEPSQPVSLSASADSETNTITLVHEAGPPLDVRDLKIKVVIDDRALFHQPPIPFVGARGFAGAPTGPFNTATGVDRWRVSQRPARGHEPPGTRRWFDGIRRRLRW